MLSSTCKYAIRASVYLAVFAKDNLVSVKVVAEKLEIPEPFLGKILQNLAKSGILKSQRGIVGGFKFNNDPNLVTLLDIVKIFDGLNVFHDCVLGMRICETDHKNYKNCPFREKIDPLLDNMYQIFKNQTIGDFASNLDSIKDFVKL